MRTRVGRCTASAVLIGRNISPTPERMMISLLGGSWLLNALRLLAFLAFLALLAAVVIVGANSAIGAEERSFCVDYSPEPDTDALVAYDLSILHEKATVDLKWRQVCPFSA